MKVAALVNTILAAIAIFRVGTSWSNRMSQRCLSQPYFTFANRTMIVNPIVKTYRTSAVLDTNLSFTYQSKQDENIIEPEPPFDDQARIHAQPNSQHYQRDEYGVDNDECIATSHRVVIVGFGP